MPVFNTDLNLPDRRLGKVRDTYTLPGAAPDGNDALLIVASDRISAFDVILPTPIGSKGVLLTEIASFWLKWIEEQGLCRTHLLSTDQSEIPDSAFTGSTTREDLVGRVTIGRKCRVIPVEFVVRGYLEGSGWKEYLETQHVCGIKLAAGLKRCEQLPEPIFTPATKADEGHDENIGFEQACAHVDAIGGRSLMEKLRDRSLAIYTAAAEFALARGIILADTKFEFGFQINAAGEIIDDDPILIDEALTPDSSRFWPVEGYAPGHSQPSFDKQFVREYLETLVDQDQWHKSPPGPEIPESVIAGTIKRYNEVCGLLLGE